MRFVVLCVLFIVIPNLALAAYPETIAVSHRGKVYEVPVKGWEIKQRCGTDLCPVTDMETAVVLAQARDAFSQFLSPEEYQYQELSEALGDAQWGSKGKQIVNGVDQVVTNVAGSFYGGAARMAAGDVSGGLTIAKSLAGMNKYSPGATDLVWSSLAANAAGGSVMSSDEALALGLQSAKKAEDGAKVCADFQHTYFSKSGSHSRQLRPMPLEEIQAAAIQGREALRLAYPSTVLMAAATHRTVKDTLSSLGRNTLYSLAPGNVGDMVSIADSIYSAKQNMDRASKAQAEFAQSILAFRENPFETDKSVYRGGLKKYAGMEDTADLASALDGIRSEKMGNSPVSHNAGKKQPTAVANADMAASDLVGALGVTGGDSGKGRATKEAPFTRQQRIAVAPDPPAAQPLRPKPPENQLKSTGFGPSVPETLPLFVQKSLAAVIRENSIDEIVSLYPSREDLGRHFKMLNISDAVIEKMRERYNPAKSLKEYVGSDGYQRNSERLKRLSRAARAARWKEWHFYGAGLDSFIPSIIHCGYSEERPWAYIDGYKIGVIGSGVANGELFFINMEFVQLATGDWHLCRFPIISGDIGGEVKEDLEKFFRLCNPQPMEDLTGIAGKINKEYRGYALRNEKGFKPEFYQVSTRFGRSEVVFKYGTNLPKGTILHLYFSDDLVDYSPFSKKFRVVVGEKGRITFIDRGIPKPSRGLCTLVFELDPLQQTAPETRRLIGERGQHVIGEKGEVFEENGVRYLRDGVAFDASYEFVSRPAR